MTNRELLNRIDKNAAYIRERPPLSEAEVKQLDAYYKIETTYSSNALEGNSLTLSETKVLLEDGITVGGKPLRDCYEATGHGKAYDHMIELARSEDFHLTEDAIKQLHFLFYSGIDPVEAGQYRKGQVFISGTEYVPPAADEVPGQMAAFMAELDQKRNTLHPVEYAAYAHRRLVDIHPFQDGNGRTARLLMNLLLIRQGYCVVSIPPILRHDYIAALLLAQGNENPSDVAFIRLIAECELETQKDYCRMLKIQLPGKEMTASQIKPSMLTQLKNTHETKLSQKAK